MMCFSFLKIFSPNLIFLHGHLSIWVRNFQFFIWPPSCSDHRLSPPFHFQVFKHCVKVDDFQILSPVLNFSEFQPRSKCPCKIFNGLANSYFKPNASTDPLVSLNDPLLNKWYRPLSSYFEHIIWSHSLLLLSSSPYPAYQQIHILNPLKYTYWYTLVHTSHLSLEPLKLSPNWYPLACPIWILSYVLLAPLKLLPLLLNVMHLSVSSAWLVTL